MNMHHALASKYIVTAVDCCGLLSTAMMQSMLPERGMLDIMLLKVKNFC